MQLTRESSEFHESALCRCTIYLF